MKRHLLAATVVLASTWSLLAQGTAPSFDVASVRPSGSAGTPLSFLSGIKWPPGRFSASNTPVRRLVAFAYDVPDYRLEGGPGWAGTERFDIEATVRDGVTVDDRRVMLRGLLAERFHLVAHDETRDAPIYELVMAREDGRFGPGLARPDDSVDCEQVDAGRNVDPAELFRRLRERLSLLADGPTCGNHQSSRPMPDGGSQSAWSAGGEPIAALTDYLSYRVERPVIDRTGLAGTFDFRLEYVEPGLASVPPEGAVAPPPDLPALFLALEEQLGLKLEETRGPVTVLVIDEVQRPDPN